MTDANQSPTRHIITLYIDVRQQTSTQRICLLEAGAPSIHLPGSGTSGCGPMSIDPSTLEDPAGASVVAELCACSIGESVCPDVGLLVDVERPANVNGSPTALSYALLARRAHSVQRQLRNLSTAWMVSVHIDKSSRSCCASSSATRFRAVSTCTYSDPTASSRSRRTLTSVLAGYLATRRLCVDCEAVDAGACSACRVSRAPYAPQAGLSAVSRWDSIRPLAFVYSDGDHREIREASSGEK